jgi:hypothetical protein
MSTAPIKETPVASKTTSGETKGPPKAAQDDNKPAENLDGMNSDKPPPQKVDVVRNAGSSETPPLSPPVADQKVIDIDKDSMAATPESIQTLLCDKMDITTAIFTKPYNSANERRPYRKKLGKIVTWNSLKRLKDRKYLNDEIIGFYFLLLQEREFADV